LQWSSVKNSVKKRFLKHTSVQALLLAEDFKLSFEGCENLEVFPRLMHYCMKKCAEMEKLKLGLKLPKHGSLQVAPSVKKKSHRG
jgi:hypothetical protein